LLIQKIVGAANLMRDKPGLEELGDGNYCDIDCRHGEQ
jgi:hypothetical protein